ncbi:WecB/TagA/CpsF family glycosyltransferase [Oceanobacillus chungangensis]|uniref:Glycosyltransferase n=1 Tax=Oceanobacillus chungangensis TaxID=1229152 RepID=A0A3D8PWS3_9BACI|nr:WecB/TagA/CpsF family glycosyltransferase [Oceanobacillus chungangensis]RDW20600.1 glycosyltransferase [Oceanobacillus chungangensis]
MENEIKIASINVNNLSKKNLLHYHLFSRLNLQQKCMVVLANSELLLETKENQAYKAVIEQADYVLPASKGLILAAKKRKKAFHEQIDSEELMIDLLKFAEVQGLSCYFLGGKDYINEKLILEIEKRFPKLSVVGHRHGTFDLNDPQIVKNVQEANADIVFVSLKGNRQEQWIANTFGSCNKGLFIGVGESFDILAGEMKRIPDQWRKLNLAWIYRILIKPSTIKNASKIQRIITQILLGKD